MGKFIVYGYFFGSSELPDVVAYAQSYEDAQMAVACATGYDTYSIATDIGGLRLAAFV